VIVKNWGELIKKKNQLYISQLGRYPNIGYYTLQQHWSESAAKSLGSCNKMNKTKLEENQERR
jgi:hypothetical protein